MLNRCHALCFYLLWRARTHFFLWRALRPLMLNRRERMANMHQTDRQRHSHTHSTYASVHACMYVHSTHTHTHTHTHRSCLSQFSHVRACRLGAEAARDATSLVRGGEQPGSAKDKAEKSGTKSPTNTGGGPASSRKGGDAKEARQLQAESGKPVGMRAECRVGQCPVVGCKRQSVYGPKGAAKPVWWYFFFFTK